MGQVRTLRGVDLDTIQVRKISSRGPVSKDFEYDESKHPNNPYGPRVG